jgi:hypothetical protein
MSDLDTYGTPEFFVQDLARVEEAGPCRRLLFTISRKSDSGGTYKTAVVSIVLPAAALPDTVQALVIDISKPATALASIPATARAN